MSLSVIDPIGPSLEHTKRVLFQPFDFVKWLKLGFCAFLASLGEGGGGSQFNTNFQGQGGGQDEQFRQFAQWVEEHLALVIAIAVIVFVLMIAIGLLMNWLSSRGHFMLVDGVVRNRGAVVEPWKEYRTQGNSLFWFRVLFGFAVFGIMLLAIGVCVLIALVDIMNEQFGVFAVIAIILGILLVFVIAFTAGMVTLFLMDFVVPIMYLRRLRVMEAWRVFNSTMLSGNVVSFVLYILFKFVIGMAVAVIAMVVTICTCCIPAIPYVGAVILLPLIVFVQSYPIFFLQQFGPEWQFISAEKEPPPEEKAPSSVEKPPTNN